MTPVTVQLLIAAGVHPTQARAFADPLQAAYEYDAFARAYFGEYARLNFPPRR